MGFFECITVGFGKRRNSGDIEVQDLGLIIPVLLWEIMGYVWVVMGCGCGLGIGLNDMVMGE